jgi:2-methylcitrate dehydratase PrpD
VAYADQSTSTGEGTITSSLTSTATASTILARHVASTGWDQVLPEQVDQLKRFLLDYLGVAIRGSQTDSGRIVGEFTADLGGAVQATVLGQPGRVPAVHAAFANAVSEHSIELDDVDEIALFHYGPPILSAALAVAQWQRSSGREFLTAVLAGCEIMARLSRATNNDLRNRGFHTTPTCGVFAATVAAGKLLGLTADQITHALGLAGAQASGLMEMYGPSMQKRFNPGPAARNGVTAAILASKGFTGADTILEGERGFGAAFSGRIDIEELLDGLGSSVPVIIEHKPYSAARPIHNAVDCALDIRSRAGQPAQEIVGVTIKRHPDWAEYHLNAEPTTFHEAQVSLPYSVAAAYILGAALPEQYADTYLHRQDLRDLSALVDVEPDSSLVRGVSCDMTVTFRDGSVFRSIVDYAKGSVQNPLTDDELRLKFRSLTAGLLPEGAAGRIEGLIDGLEELVDMNELMELVTVVTK